MCEEMAYFKLTFFFLKIIEKSKCWKNNLNYKYGDLFLLPLKWNIVSNSIFTKNSNNLIYIFFLI